MLENSNTSPQVADNGAQALAATNVQLATAVGQFAEVDMDKLRIFDNCVNIDDQLVLIDNISSEQDKVHFVEIVTHPVKLSFIVVVLCVGGSMKVSMNMREYELSLNKVLVAQDESICEFLSISDDFKGVVMAFDRKVIQYNASNVDVLLTLKRTLSTQPVMSVEQDVVDKWLTVYNLMRANAGEISNPFRKEALLGFTQALLFDCYNYLLKNASLNHKQTSAHNRQQELYEHFVEAVKENYATERSIKAYADMLCVTPKYLSQVVKSVSGRLAGDWIADYVILEAKALLKSRKYSIQQISELLHFANQSFFGKYFKDKAGCTPTEYQKK